MAAEPYLIRLGTRLASGLASFDDARSERHRSFILSQQKEDGGFSGREGDSDLYYTAFAVRSLAMLGSMTKDDANRIGQFLAPYSLASLNVVDLVSWLYSALVTQLAGGDDLLASQHSDWATQVTAQLEELRGDDGGYAKSIEGKYGSTYTTFLIVLVYELLGQKVPNPNSLIQFIFDRQRDDGGFVEIEPMKRSGTNPTAAAVAVLTIYASMDDELRSDVRDFLCEVRSSEGGFQANTRIPFADGLSTFTGLLTLQDLGIGDVLKLEKTKAFITEWLEFPTGGCRGASWDEQADVEYTFYGLGTLALLG